MRVEIFSHSMELLPQRAIWLTQWKTLLVADLHLGKINHFRKAGIPVPAKANTKNSETLIALLQTYQPDRVIFLGDLFHSHYNEEWEVLGQIRKHFAACEFELVLGNHDILSRVQYDRHQLSVFVGSRSLGNLILTHEPLEEIPEGQYNICGHIHPAVRLQGNGRQSVTLPCFYFGGHQAILPAFGSFTGMARIVPKKEDKIFVIADNKVMAYASA